MLTWNSGCGSCQSGSGGTSARSRRSGGRRVVEVIVDLKKSKILKRTKNYVSFNVYENSKLPSYRNYINKLKKY